MNLTKMQERLNVKPLSKLAMNGNIVLDDKFMYTPSTSGLIAINTNRYKYCKKMYASEKSIKSIVGDKLMDDDLKLFILKVSDKIVFEKYGKWYGIEVYKKTRRTYGIKRVYLYKWAYDPNRQFYVIYAYNLSLYWKSAFHIYSPQMSSE